MDVYIFQAALICACCAEEFMNSNEKPHNSDDSDCWPNGPFRDGGGEADSPQHCDMCLEFLNNELTPDGEQYVCDSFLEYVETGRGRLDVLLEWKESYPYAFDHIESVSIPMLIEENGKLTPLQKERWKELTRA